MNPVLDTFTINECNVLVKKKLGNLDYEPVSYKVIPANMNSFFADAVILKVTCCDRKRNTKKLQFLVKTMSEDRFLRTIAEEGNVYLKEFFLYRILRPEFLKYDVRIVQECCPMCFLTISPDYLVFEDLSVLGYSTIAQRESLNVECVKICLDSLAKLHCSVLIYEERISKKAGVDHRLAKTYPSIFKEALFSGEHYSAMLLEAIKTGIDALVDLFVDPDGVDVKDLKEFACRAVDDFPNVLKPSNRFRNTICHGNLCPGNMLFKFVGTEPTHCYLVGFNYYRYLPPAQDFMGMMYLSTDREFREKHMEKVTSFYYERLSEILKDHDLEISKILPGEEFIASCNRYKLFAIAQTFHYFPHTLLTADQRKFVANLPGGLHRSIFGHRRYSIQKVCDGDEVYRRRLSEIVKDLEDVFQEKISES